MRILTAALFITVSLHAATRPPAASQGGPYFWTTGTYQYDGSGNITTMGTHTFTYDPLNRLSASYMTTPDTVSNKTYTYDSFGNLTRQTTGDVVTLLPTGLTTNHLDATIAGYDDAGDVTQLHPPDSADTYGFTYDALGAVTAATVDGVAVSNFVYTADDERLRMENITTGVKHWRVRGLNQTVLRDFQHAGSTWSVSRHYIYRGPLLAAITPTTVEHFSLDHLGSPRLLTDVVGNKIAQHTYLPFGKELGAMTNDGEPMKFTGHERDDDPAGGMNQLDYMHARYYSSGLGRFLAVDTGLKALAATTSPQRWNHYIYASDNPLVRVDPDGKVDQRTIADRAILENPDVLQAAAVIIANTGYDRKTLAQRSEYGVVVTNLGNHNYGIDRSVVTSHSPLHVDYTLAPGKHTTMSGLPVAATMHSHVGTGYIDPKKITRGDWSSAADKVLAQQTGEPVYILNGTTSMVRYDTATGHDTTILDGPDYQQYLERAMQAVFTNVLTHLDWPF